jgi:putative acyl-CoA dehydrogenase
MNWWAQVVLLGADVRCVSDLAQTDKGLTCFLLPRHRPDDTRNQFYIQRLKNKLGNCSNASSEVEFRGALAWMVGEEGRGVPTIIEMVAMTRFDCMVGSSADAPGADPGQPSLRAPLGRRQIAQRAAVDAERAGRPGPGKRSGAGLELAHGPALDHLEMSRKRNSPGW